MAENKDKQLDAFIRKAVKHAGLEAPSVNFTEEVLSRLDAPQTQAITSYRPLISWRSWAVITAIFAGLGILAFSGGVELGVTWPERLNLDLVALSKPEFLDKFTNINLSNIVIYGLLGLAIFFYAQIWLLKNHVNKRYAL